MWRRIRSNKRKLTTVAVIGLPLLILVIVLAVTIPRLYAEDDYEDDDEVQVDENFQTCMLDEAKVCTSSDCHKAAEYLLSNMNLKVDPCTDFYQYACGSYRGNKSFSSAVEHVKINFYKKVAKYMNDGVFKVKTNYIQFITEFWKRCLDLDMTQSHGARNTILLLNNVYMSKLPAFLDGLSKPSSTFDWVKSAAFSKRLMDNDIFFSFRVTHDLFRIKYAMVLSFKLVKPGRFLQHSSGTTVFSMPNLESIKEIISTVLTKDVYEGGSDKIWAAAKIVKDMEEEFAKLQDYFHDLKADDIDYNKIHCKRLSHFKEEFNGKLSMKEHSSVWTRYFDFVFKDIKLPINYKEENICYSSKTVDYLVKLLEWIYASPLVHLELYIWFTLVREMVPLIKVDEDSTQREMHCAALVTDFFPLILASEGILPHEIYFSHIKDILKRSESSFIERVNHAKWIDGWTREIIMDKIQHRLDLIGYHEKAFAVKFVTDYYKDLAPAPDDLSLVVYICRIITYDSEKLISRLGTSYEDQLWLPPAPFFVRIKFLHYTNILMIHNAFMKFPLYFAGSSSALMVVNHGLFGSAMTQQFLQAVNGYGRLYDKFGYRNARKIGWSAGVLKKIGAKERCFVRLYEHFMAYGRSFYDRGDALVEMDTNLGDNGGLRHSYRAYKIFIEERGCGEALPGFTSYTDDKLFFISFANKFCETLPLPQKIPEYVRKYSEKGELPPSDRVNNVLRNNIYFLKAFECSAGTKMNPTDMKQCLMW